jgi:uncharacterized protein
MSERKIINDPVFGFIGIPNGLLFEIVQHPYFQRLQRIKQLGLSAFVYPGAQHTRLLHSLGAMHLTREAIKRLRQKGNAISDTEAEGVLAAILMHDIGHGPFSHVLEHTLTHGVLHEEISLRLMQKMNAEMGGKLDLAISIFEDRYPKHFLHQLISSQLDMDRMDYLQRDCFFTGVAEGRIGSARIINMLNIHDDKLVVEQNGIYSIENFLIARRFMYWQVYLHKTSVAAEKMLIQILRRAQELAANGTHLEATPALRFFIEKRIDATNFDDNALRQFVALDDSDLISAVKVWTANADTALSTLAKAFIDRHLFKTAIGQPLTDNERNALLKKYADHFKISLHEARYFFEEQTVTTSTYDNREEQILVLLRDGTVRDIADISDIIDQQFLEKHVKKTYLCHLPI